MKEEKQVASKTKLTLQLQKIGGLWTNIEQFEEFRENGPECVYREALITQIQFRKVVLGCGTIPKNLFCQSKQGKPFTISKLENNLKEILMLSMEETEVVEKRLT